MWILRERYCFREIRSPWRFIAATGITHIYKHEAGARLLPWAPERERLSNLQVFGFMGAAFFKAVAIPCSNLPSLYRGHTQEAACIFRGDAEREKLIKKDGTDLGLLHLAAKSMGRGLLKNFVLGQKDLSKDLPWSYPVPTWGPYQWLGLAGCAAVRGPKEGSIVAAL